MSLEDFRYDAYNCIRCSNCKWLDPIWMQSQRYAKICPSSARYLFDAYSAQGRLDLALGLIDRELDYTPKFLDIVYKCTMGGACDTMCKRNLDLEVWKVLLETRARLVEDGQLLPAHISVIEGLRKEDNMLQRLKADRGKWAEGLDVKDLTKQKAEVCYYAGCRFSYDEDLWKVARGALTLLNNHGVDVGIMGREEACCGGRAYEMGYCGELTKYAEHNTEAWAAAGVRTVVTSCAECYHAFKVLYPEIGKKVEVLHITEYLDRVISEGEIKLSKKVSMKVAYHDPCHLGRMGEPYVHWEGTRGKFGRLTPPKEFRRGTYGVYEPPRNVLRSIPGLQLVEMERIRENAWCCGAGGGVKEAYPDFGLWTAGERIEEAKSTGVEGLVTACPWCERNFIDAIKERDDTIKVYDVVELTIQAIQGYEDPFPGKQSR